MNDPTNQDWYLDISDQVEEWRHNLESDIYDTPFRESQPKPPRIFRSEFDLPDDDLLMDD